jgi:hypothetical protein
MVIFVGNTTQDPDTIFARHVAKHGLSIILTAGEALVPLSVSEIDISSKLHSRFRNAVNRKYSKIISGTHAIQLQCESGKWDIDPVVLQIRKFA